MKSPIHAQLTMKTLTPIIVCYILLGAARGEDTCYEDVGCFPDGPPWSGTKERPVSLPPQSPKEIGTRYFLLTRENPQHPQVISAMNLTAFNSSSFQTSRKTVLIIHGLDNQAHDNWVSDMCHELLLKENINCIGVDWRNGSGNLLTYPQPVSNVRVVSAQVGLLLKMLLEEKNYPLTNIYIVGHSLGAHIAGGAGKRYPGIHRITGLEPSGPMFENTDKEVRLDRSDARHVDVIYTDIEAITGFGLAQVIGDLNFYPNGGKRMPGCPNKAVALLNVTDLKESVACDHFRAYRYFTDTIRSPEGYISYPCDSCENFTSGACFPCPPQGCPTMGYYAERWFNMSDQEQKKFYLNTGGNPPYFPRWRYRVDLTLNGKTSESTYISFYGSGGNVTDHQLGSVPAIQKSFQIGPLLGGGLTPTPRNYISEFMDSPVKLHPLRYVTFCWTSKKSNPQTELGAARIDIQTGEDGTTSSFCGKETVSHGVVQALGRCA